MANVYIKGRSPKGTVGVDGVVDSGELSAYTAGVLSGFGGKSVSSWTIQVGGQTGEQDTAVAKNPSGESELFAGTPGQSIGFTLPGAPGTPGRSQVHALVIYKDPFTVSVVNNAVDVIDYQVVSGTSATTGSQVAPDDAAIRSAIPSGSLKFVTVVGYVTIAYGASSVSLGNLVVNYAALDSDLVATGSLPLNKLTGSAWTSYTPTWTNVNVTGATQASKYVQIGKLVVVRLSIVLGTASPVSGEIVASLPVTRATYGGTLNVTPLGTAILFDLSTPTLFFGTVSNATTTTVIIRPQSASGTYVSQALASSTVPFTWASGDEINATFVYEAV